MLVGPINALAPSKVARLEDSKGVAAGSFNGFHTHQICIGGSAYEILKAIDGFEADILS